MTVAIIGAGMAGLSCAQALVASGKAVRVFDKGRGPGGRMSTRRVETPLGEVRFDHGTTAFEASAPEFVAQVEAWVQAGFAAPLEARCVRFDEGGQMRGEDETRLWVGAPGMNAIIRNLAAGLDVSWGERVVSVRGAPGAWWLDFESERPAAGPFSAVIVAVPAEQASDLLAPIDPAFATRAEAVTSTPCWAAMLAYEAGYDPGFDRAICSASPLGLIQRETVKPGRGVAQAFVLHATPDWSRENLERDAGDVAAALAGVFRELTGAPAPVYCGAHRWRFAQVDAHATGQVLFDAETGIGACGDWLAGGGVEGAWRSGQALAARMIITPA